METLIILCLLVLLIYYYKSYKLHKQMHEYYKDEAKKNFEDSISNIIYNVLVVTLLWIAVSSFIQRFKCPSMTETELFLHIPKSVVCDWKYCSNNLFKYQNNNESKRDY